MQLPVFRSDWRASAAPAALLTALAAALAAPAFFTHSAHAETATQLPPVSVEAGEACPQCSATLSGADLADKRAAAAGDTAALLSGLPGVSLYSNGGVSSLPVIHGMNDDRVKVQINGMPVPASCPNHMNPALSYIDPANVGKVEVMAGLTPVSAGGDSIAGTISINSAAPVFAEGNEPFAVHGGFSTFYRSNAHGYGGSVNGSAAVRNFSVGYTAAIDRAGNYHRGGDGLPVGSTKYHTRNQVVTVAGRDDDARHMVVVQAGQQYIPYEAFPNQRMDMTSNMGLFLNGHYAGEFSWGKVDLRAYGQEVKHQMNFLPEKYGTMFMPMNTIGTDAGYTLKVEVPFGDRDTFRIGNEYHFYKLTDWWPGVTRTNGSMGPNDFYNLNNGRRQQLGAFGEWERKWTPEWTTLLGARTDAVWTSADPVQGYAPINRSGTTWVNYLYDANRFNAAERAKADLNFDATAQVRYEPDQTGTYEAGYARKSRSPNLYERYTWSSGAMASTMIGWFGDGNGYIGNINLRPEVAHTASVTAGWHDDARKDWEIKVSPYYTFVEDYIGVKKTANLTAGFVQMRFVNQEAQFWGVDLSGRVALWDSPQYGRTEFSGVAGWVHGETTGDANGVYHLMPANTRLALGHKLDGWSAAVEVQLVTDKDTVDNLRKEFKTPGYALLNLRGGYDWRQNVRVDLGVENVFDTKYYSPQGGVSYGDYKLSNSTQVGPLPGPGRSFTAGLTVKF